MGRGRIETVSVLQPNSPVGLLLKGEGSAGGAVFTDSSPYVHTLTRTTVTGSISTSTTQKKFGSASIHFNASGSGTYLTTADDPVFQLGLGDFTIDFWIYPTATANYAPVISKWNRSFDLNNNWIIAADNNNDGKVMIRRYISSSNDYRYFSTALTLNAWNHVAITRSGTTWRGFLGGVNVLEFTSTFDANTTSPVYLGSPSDGSGASCSFYLDELRLVKGLAVWTSNFNPPGEAY